MQVTQDGDSAYIWRQCAQSKCGQNAPLAPTSRGETNKKNLKISPYFQLLLPHCNIFRLHRTARDFLRSEIVNERRCK
jgi:hypothetical protein